MFWELHEGVTSQGDSGIWGERETHWKFFFFYFFLPCACFVFVEKMKKLWLDVKGKETRINGEAD